MDNGTLFVIVLLALCAGFLGLRLYAVLGRRTGHEQQPMPRAAEEPPVPIVQPRTIDMQAEPREQGPRLFDTDAERGIRAVISADPHFDIAQFIEGAKSAYRMILEAFWKGDRDTLGWLTEGEVRQAFIDAIDAREAAGHTLENRLITIERATITEARIEGGVAHVVVRFDADIAAVTRDSEGQVIAGSLTDAEETHDLWTFSRTLRSGDPNWKLTDTDEA